MGDGPGGPARGPTPQRGGRGGDWPVPAWAFPKGSIVRYLGGKSRLAREIASIVNAARGPGVPFWEPFCGGLSVSVQLAKAGPGIVSDASVALISLYQAVRDGWDPPESVSEAEYHQARTLPETDPLHAFA